LRVGVHPNNLHLLLASRWPDGLGEGFSFVPYGEGRKSAVLLLDGSIDVCGTGSTPPILARADGLDVRTIAASATRPANGGLVVHQSSAIESVADLRGRRVALLDGSFHTYLLARALENEGLGLRDIVRVELSPAASLRAIEAGEVDAWVAMAPLLDQAIGARKVRLLAACGELIPNRSMFWTLDRRGLDAATIAAVTEALVRFGEKVAANPDIAARLLAEARANDADLAAWRAAVAGRDWTIYPANPGIIAEQQAEADTLLRHGDLSVAVEMA